MKTLIVIASYENPDRLDYLFNDNSDFWKSGIDADVLLVNNGSRSLKYKLTCERYSDKIIINIRENNGRETGAFDYAEKKHINYDRYMFLQCDTQIIQTPWLKPFQEMFDNTENCGAVGFRVYTEDIHLGKDDSNGQQVQKILKNILVINSYMIDFVVEQCCILQEKY